ncbi:ParB/RepB/Spo0J family partition protein [Bifidobacterium tibiigranuli]|jgi:ParB family chromosome partitioning protein|uniref:ParB/RepB/Spo0J family partition protein n=1 Tax=Bifidobacterium tibiigranuli TaxID=2172043 RepID=UPI0026F0148A|nr:ParB/RepB/Spo0J family partition protein [Bifidobacterium tibiigranuli]MCI1649084.1 ParB/RepB/Spo0J family partition protein [Bifidobacterium tibiigranuli]MCI2186319.1 ParB/RepB/Spo0J family partition protein [Bifidobacterium tibiigranuli]MCI2203855.1 ParB/RepB/Spo0J family partition protein [Bifidobacterium tibiigranuli]
MARKSRLGKGLGALFPDLPGETPTAATAESRNNTVMTTPKDSATSGDESAVPTPSTTKKSKQDITAKEAAKKSTANSDSAKAHRETKKPLSPLIGKNEEVQQTLASATNVSRETSRTKKKKRASIPTLHEMTHPSDMFFGTDSGKPYIPAVSDNHEQNHAGTAATSKPAASTTSAPKTSSAVESTGAGKKLHESSVELAPVHGGYLAELRLSDVGPNIHQPRTVFDEDELKELADSITEVGVLQPIVVRKRPEDQIAAFHASQKAKAQSQSQSSASANERNGNAESTAVAHRRVQDSLSSIIGTPAQDRLDSEYELIMGERRWRASQMAGLDTIPAIVKTTADDDMLRDALLENLHRVNLNPLEEAAAYQQMIKEFGLTQAELSHSISKSRPQIANTLRLLNLPGSVQKRVAAGVLSAGHARALLGLSTTEDMDKLATRIIAEGLSVRSTEEIVALKTLGEEQPKKTKQMRNNPWADSPIQHNLENHFDTKVAIKGNQKHGRIEIVFSSPEDMDRIVSLLMPGNASSISTTNESGWV